MHVHVSFADGQERDIPVGPGFALWFQNEAGETVDSIGLEGVDEAYLVLQEVDPEVVATPAAEALAAEAGVDLSAVEGSGAGGKVTVSDVKTTIEGATFNGEPAESSGT